LYHIKEGNVDLDLGEGFLSLIHMIFTSFSFNRLGKGGGGLKAQGEEGREGLEA